MSSSAKCTGSLHGSVSVCIREDEVLVSGKGAGRSSVLLTCVLDYVWKDGLGNGIDGDSQETPAHIASCGQPQNQLGFHKAQPCALYLECKDPGCTAAFTG